MSQHERTVSQWCPSSWCAYKYTPNPTPPTTGTTAVALAACCATPSAVRRRLPTTATLLSQWFISPVVQRTPRHSPCCERARWTFHFSEKMIPFVFGIEHLRGYRNEPDTAVDGHFGLFVILILIHVPVENKKPKVQQFNLGFCRIFPRRHEYIRFSQDADEDQ